MPYLDRWMAICQSFMSSSYALPSHRSSTGERRLGFVSAPEYRSPNNTAHKGMATDHLSSAMTFFQGKRNETFPERFTIVS